MDLRDIRYFETIAELEHLGRAAAKLHRSPPALTKCVRRLEESLGTALFEREGRGIRLTAAGHALRRRARLLDVAMDDTLREIGAVTRGASGHLRVGVVPTIAQYLLPGACRTFLAGSPGVTIETLIGMSNFLRDALRTGAIDMAISVHSRADEFVAHPIVDDDVVVVAGSDHEIFRKRPTLADLARYQWVLPSASYAAAATGADRDEFRDVPAEPDRGDRSAQLRITPQSRTRSRGRAAARSPRERPATAAAICPDLPQGQLSVAGGDALHGAVAHQRTGVVREGVSLRYFHSAMPSLPLRHPRRSSAH